MRVWEVLGRAWGAAWIRTAWEVWFCEGLGSLEAGISPGKEAGNKPCKDQATQS